MRGSAVRNPAAASSETSRIGARDCARPSRSSLVRRFYLPPACLLLALAYAKANPPIPRTPTCRSVGRAYPRRPVRSLPGRDVAGSHASWSVLSPPEVWPSARGVAAVEARGAAQAWQAAGAWAQVGAVWQGTDTEVTFESGHLAVTSRAQGLVAAILALPLPLCRQSPTWSGGGRGRELWSASLRHPPIPNSAGSLYFRAPGSDYRVTIRLESGLTVRTRVEAAP